MKVREILPLVEGYKEATADFSAEADKQTVASVIDQYKELVKRNQVLGDERNIDYWRKQGWGKFNSFVETKSAKSSVTQIKRKKVAGNSITLQEDDTWLIVIPLDKDASCFHGKNSDWCTTKVNQSNFEDYFYDFEVTLIYCLNKTNAGMWAIAAYSKTDKIELFDQEDSSLTVARFKEQTGLDPELLAKKALSAEHKPVIDGVRGNYKEMIRQQKELISQMEVGKRNQQIEELLLKTKDSDLCDKYVKNAGIHDGYPLAIQLAVVRRDGRVIQYIKNPSKEVQLAATNRNGLAIQHIENPSEDVQLAAVNQDAYAIQHIENPSEDAQLAAFNKTLDAFRYIKNPSKEVQLAAVNRDGWTIMDLKNPSEEVQIAAVKQNGSVISSIKNPSEEVQIAAVKESRWAIEKIKNPTPKVVALAKQTWEQK